MHPLVTEWNSLTKLGVLIGSRFVARTPVSAKAVMPRMALPAQHDDG
jgi:hypothetical protein